MVDKYIQVLVLVLRAVTVVGIAKISWCTGFLKKNGYFFYKFVKNASFFSKINSQTICNMPKIVQNGGSPVCAGCVWGGGSAGAGDNAAGAAGGGCYQS